ncbi:sigma-54-dependent Fis family transcriptional regulator [Desulfuromonas versatilis]|uniref:Sigma-54-dependent Fis family transcriptional regulator n=1 Tax=Desulfuromonas versatilis TaxID=2802975 RepID=A0ABN6E2J1_9BACT|nr:sigma-54 dependent transcriptional regulator [Desulfuromonas versatilis]BCR06374.1 sigma-54-dependent Fis family transcriptional regulator [Desulfuromonas versatilis]
MKAALYPKNPVLLVDDEPAWLRSLGRALERSAGINNQIVCQDSRQVMQILARQPASLVLLDLTMPHLPGEELLGSLVQNHPETPVIILTGVNQVETSVRCMKQGAFDFFVKGVEEERLAAGVLRAIRMQELDREVRELKNGLLDGQVENLDAFSGILTRSPKMHAIFRYIEAVAPSSQPVLVTGESGAGKELVARALHLIGRPEGPWVPVNVAGLDDSIFSDTLFGHTRGAFTGADRARAGMIEQAAGGTLFLDEIGDLSPASQVKLLRLLQEGEYLPIGADRPKRSSARIIVATNQNLAALQASGAFRKDLFYRLQGHQVQLPPLRERPEDLPLLLEHFLAKAARELGKRKPTAPEELAVLLATYHFPGNIRELEGMVHNAVATHQAGKLSTQSFRVALGLERSEATGNGKGAASGPETPGLVFGDQLPTLSEAADLLVAEALSRSQGNQTIAAGLLGITRPALSKRLKKLRA